MDCTGRPGGRRLLGTCCRWEKKSSSDEEKTEKKESRGMGPRRGVGAGEAHATDVISFPCAASGSSKEGATLQQPFRQQPLKVANMPVRASKNIMAAQARRTCEVLPQMLDAKYLRRVGDKHASRRVPHTRANAS